MSKMNNAADVLFKRFKTCIINGHGYILPIGMIGLLAEWTIHNCLTLLNTVMSKNAVCAYEYVCDCE